MASNDRASPPDSGPLRIAIAEAYQHAAGLSDYFGRLTDELRRGGDVIPDPGALAEAEAMIAALALIVRELPRLVPGFAERLKAAEERPDEAARG
jgi:hypothetical protein